VKASLCVRNCGHDEVQWHVELQRHDAVIKLTPAHQHPNAQPQAWTQRPTSDDIASLVRAGAIEVHPSRQPLAREAVSWSMVTVQFQAGQWTEQACQALRNDLNNPKRGSEGRTRGVPLLALKDCPRSRSLDRCWRFLKDRLSINQNTKARSNLLRAKLRSAQYQYWYKNADMWVATGSLCQWASKRFMGKK